MKINNNYILCLIMGMATAVYAQVLPADGNVFNLLNQKIERLEFNDEPLDQVLKMITEKTGLNIVKKTSDIDGRVTVSLSDLILEDTLRMILKSVNLAYTVIPSSENYPQGYVKVMLTEEFSREFGYHFESEMGTEVVTIQNSLAAPAIKRIFEELKSSSGKVVFNDTTNTFILTDFYEKVKVMLERVKDLDVEVEKKNFQLKNVTAEDVKTSLAGMLTPDLSIVEIIGPQELNVMDTENKLAEITKYIEDLDSKKILLTVKVEVLQLILDDDSLQGVDWEAILSGYKEVAFKGFGDSVKHKIGIGTLTQDDVDVLVDALDIVGDRRVVMSMSKENVSVMDIDLVVKNLLFLAQGDVINTRNQQDAVSYVLEFTQIKDSGCDVAFQAKYKGTQGIYQSDMGVKLNILQGNSVIVGGLFKNVMVASKRKIPLLGDIPFLRTAFRSQGRKQGKTELIVLIKPEIQVQK